MTGMYIIAGVLSLFGVLFLIVEVPKIISQYRSYKQDKLLYETWKKDAKAPTPTPAENKQTTIEDIQKQFDEEQLEAYNNVSQIMQDKWHNTEPNKPKEENKK